MSRAFALAPPGGPPFEIAESVAEFLKAIGCVIESDEDLIEMLYRRGILDGPAGWQYCAMISTYEYWTELKIRELSRPWHEETMRLAERMMAEPGERGGGGA